MASHKNRLAGETSPYLLQHAHNPVDWFPWGEEALQKALEQDKPILVSIGYSACHWCHVMEKESFEDERTAAIMNEHFVNIKIDREERPDLDHIYMDAVQAMTGSGGWPLNVFLTPDARPFYGGTYFPPRPAFNRPSWMEVLINISTAYKQRKDEISEQAAGLTRHLVESNSFGLQSPAAKAVFEDSFTRIEVDKTFENLIKNADREEGGFGRPPKFPQSFSIRFLLHYFYYTKNIAALEQVCLSLDKMIYGGIYDQLGGGFARYSTDAEWLVPHFEKMLYDNAVLIDLLSEAYQLTGHERYKLTIEHTIDFVKGELMDGSFGFYSALDADSEGEEGRFYVWTKREVEDLLGGEASLFCLYYDVTEDGNWEHKNILRVKSPLPVFAANLKMDEAELALKLKACRERLMTARTGRVRPQLDDKILLGWNALMNSALSKASAALSNQAHKNMAVENMKFLLSNFQGPKGDFFHTYKKGIAKHPAFLDDYSYLIQALIQLHEITADKEYLIRAKDILELVVENFSEESTGFFFYTHKDQRDVIVRKKEVYDGAQPSGNAIMACNLFYLAAVFNRPEWKLRSVQICNQLKNAIVRYPSSFGVWATFGMAMSYGIPEIALVGKKFKDLHEAFLRTFTPFKIYQASEQGDEAFPLLSGKPSQSVPFLYLCKNYACQNPVNTVNELVRLLENV